MSQKFNQRPSSLLQLDDPYVAYCVDEVCFVWGTHVEYELELASRDPKDLTRKEYKQATARRTRTFTQLMDGEAEAKPVPRRSQFKDPATLFSSKK